MLLNKEAYDFRPSKIKGSLCDVLNKVLKQERYYTAEEVHEIAI